MDSGDQCIYSVRVGKAAWVPVLIGVGAKVLKERLPQRLRLGTVGNAWTSGIDRLLALVADQLPGASHTDIVAYTAEVPLLGALGADACAGVRRSARATGSRGVSHLEARTVRAGHATRWRRTASRSLLPPLLSALWTYSDVGHSMCQ